MFSGADIIYPLNCFSCAGPIEAHQDERRFRRALGQPQEAAGGGPAALGRRGGLSARGFRGVRRALPPAFHSDRSPGEAEDAVPD